MTYILLPLLLVSLLIVFTVYKVRTASKQKLQHESERRTESAPTARPKNKYHAIQVTPCDNSCNAASWVSEKIFLAKDLSNLPLESCDRILDCKCKFVHHTDRRQNDDRRSGSPTLQNVFKGNESRKQKKKGRRQGD